MDSYLLRQFVAVAERENIGRAAQDLHMSASPLSRRIRLLEDELGITLFHREHRGIRITSPGQLLLEDAQRLLALEDKVASRATALARGTGGRVVVGFVESALRSGMLTSALRTFSLQHPGVVVDMRNLRTDSQIRMLVDNDLDLAITHRCPGDDQTQSKMIHSENFRLAVSAENVLHEDGVSIETLASQRWIAISAHASPQGHSDFIAMCETAGFTPDIVCEVASPSAALELVAAGLGAAMMQASSAHPDVQLLDLPETLDATLEIWATTSKSPESLAQTLWTHITG